MWRLIQVRRQYLLSPVHTLSCPSLLHRPAFFSFFPQHRCFFSLSSTHERPRLMIMYSTGSHRLAHLNPNCGQGRDARFHKHKIASHPHGLLEGAADVRAT